MTEKRETPKSIMDIVFYDTETTGLSVTKDCIIELGMKRVTIRKYPRTRSNHDHFICKTTEVIDTMIKTDRQIPQEATNVHGITSEKLQNKNTFDSYVEDIRDICIGARYLCSYNGHNFDDLILKNEMFRHGSKMPNIRSLDLIVLVRYMEPLLISYKLCDVIKHLGLEGNNSHRAFDDVECVQSLYLYLCNAYDTDGDGLYEIQERLSSIHGTKWSAKDINTLLTMYSTHMKMGISPVESSRTIYVKLGRSLYSILLKLKEKIRARDQQQQLGRYIQKAFITPFYKQYSIEKKDIEEISAEHGVSQFNLKKYFKKCKELGFY